MKGVTVCVMLKYDRESLDKAPMDGGVDVLRHFEESINFEYKKSNIVKIIALEFIEISFLKNISRYSTCPCLWLISIGNLMPLCVN